MTAPAQAHAALVTRFYEAFARRDHATMGACYHDDARFCDPVFPGLDAAEARAMWHMLCERGKDLQLTFSDVEADELVGRARWVATYTFSATGRAVENRIEARFRFKDGLFVEHTDTFDFWRWAKQALGPAGLALGWSGVMRNKVRAQARAGLLKFMERA